MLSGLADSVAFAKDFEFAEVLDISLRFLPLAGRLRRSSESEDLGRWTRCAALEWTCAGLSFG